MFILMEIRVNSDVEKTGICISKDCVIFNTVEGNNGYHLPRQVRKNTRVGNFIGGNTPGSRYNSLHSFSTVVAKRILRGPHGQEEFKGRSLDGDKGE